MKNSPYSVEERFVRYVQIDTTADPESLRFPSSEKQKDLSRLLVQELKELGISDAETDQWGYVYATIPSNVTTAVPYTASTLERQLRFQMTRHKSLQRKNIPT